MHECRKGTAWPFPFLNELKSGPQGPHQFGIAVIDDGNGTDQQLQSNRIVIGGLGGEVIFHFNFVVAVQSEADKTVGAVQAVQNFADSSFLVVLHVAQGKYPKCDTIGVIFLADVLEFVIVGLAAHAGHQFPLVTVMVDAVFGVSFVEGFLYVGE